MNKYIAALIPSLAFVANSLALNLDQPVPASTLLPLCERDDVACYAYIRAVQDSILVLGKEQNWVELASKHRTPRNRSLFFCYLIPSQSLGTVEIKDRFVRLAKASINDNGEVVGSAFDLVVQTFRHNSCIRNDPDELLANPPAE